MNRRHLLSATVGVGAAAAGVAWSLRSSRPQEPSATDAVWTERFERPEGGELALSDWKGRPLLLNFWATWCAPCVEEMPLLDNFFEQNASKGWQVVGLAVDSPTPVREFLQRQPMRFPIGLAGLGGVDLSRSLGNERGALPFSAIFDRQGAVVHRKLGAFSHEELANWSKAIA